MLWLLLLLLGLALCACGFRWLWAYAHHIEPHRVEVTRHEVLCPDLPAALDGLTLCQLSDLHIGARRRNEAAITAALRATQADLYVFTGDMIYLQSGVAAFFRWLDCMDAVVRPAVAILGNAEHKSFVRGGEVLQGLADRAIPVLNNRAHRFPWKGAELQIVGVDDPHTHHSDFDRAFAQARPGEWTLLLCHSPDGVAELNGYRADLILCGHTHGGQLRLPLIGGLTANTRRVQGLIAGWYEGEALARRMGVPSTRSRLYISRGLGTGGIAGRLLCPPELPVFTLRCAELKTENGEAGETEARAEA